MAIEDFTSWSPGETDPNSHITVTSSKVACAGLARNEDAYHLDDAGAGHFGDFTHELEYTLTSASASNSVMGVWCASNDVDDMANWYSDFDEAVSLYVYGGSGGSHRLDCRQNEARTADNSTTLTNGTKYYLTITRSGTSWTCAVYDAAAKGPGDLVDTISLALPVGRTYQYIFATNTWYTAISANATGDIEDLDLNEAPPPSQTMPIIAAQGIHNAVFSGLVIQG